ncbi:MAG: hypothetical protein MK207_13545 [Saprospiraceae bacterium]|nr:hypothetical protein [Saprospiraceae bacterium]
MKKKALLDFLVNVENQGVVKLHISGYRWFKSIWLPRLGLADLLIPEHAALLADCWYLMGDVYDFNCAPLKAIECYKKAIQYDESIDGAYREIANMYKQIGHYSKALNYINIAIDMMPDNTEIKAEKEEIQDCINYDVEPFLTDNNQCWKLNEKLANQEFDFIIQLVSQIDNPELNIIQCLARAYGAQANFEKYLETWGQITNSNLTFSLEYADWFYMPDEILNSSEIWQMIKSASGRIDEANFMIFDSFTENYGNQLTKNQVVNLIADFYIFKANSNKQGIKNLVEKFPLWKELKE